MKTPTINSRILKLEVLKDTATRTSVNAVESRTTSLESDVATAQGDISTLQGDVATLTQGIVDAVSTHNTAPDAHADIRTLIGDRALSVHQHTRTDLPWISDPGAALLTAESASAQRTALGMTAWAVAPWTDGTTSDIPEGTQLYFTNARTDARIAAQKGQAEGLAPLDAGGKVPSANLPDSIVGQVIYKGLWDASTNTPTLPTASAAQGYYYITSVSGVYAWVAFDVGDWCISDGTAWGKVDNSDAIASFAGRTGAILPIASDYSSFYLGLHAPADDSSKLGGQLPSYYSGAGHVHNYAGSSSPGGAATSALECTGNSATANAAKYPQFHEDAMSMENGDITQRVMSGIYQGAAEHVSNSTGWPINGEWMHLIAATHTNKSTYYSMQLSGSFYTQRFFARNTNGSGNTPWLELVTSGNAGTTIADNALTIAKTNGLHGALNVRALAYPAISFGGDSNTWTTSEFVAFCQQSGLFGAPYVSVRGTWSYASNRIISDTGCGDIHLAGALVEVFVGTIYEYLIRVTTAPSGTGTTATKAVFVYQNHGAGYSPGWIRIASAPDAGFTGAKVIGGTTLNFVNGLLVS